MKFHVFPPTDPTAPERAILIFAGWGMDEKPFASLKQEGYRIIAVWDYREPAFPPSLVEELEQYREIAVIGWSFGVPAATRFLAVHPELPVSARIAVNGTMHPVSDSLGIPEAIFRGTLAGLSEKTLSKFNLRMCGSAESYRRFSLTLPARDIDGLRSELVAVESAGDACGAIWDTAIVGTADRIIPPENQLRAWQGGEAVETLTVADGPHLPDFQAIINEFITEKGLVAEKFGRAVETYDDNAVVQRQIAEKLCSQAIAAGAADCRSILEIGCGTGLTTRMLAEAFPDAEITGWDLHIPHAFSRAAGCGRIKALECDAETQIRQLPDASVDMIFSASTVQWFNSLPEFLRQTARVLRPGGLAFISTFGPATMRQIRDILPQATHYPPAAALRRMIPPSLHTLCFEEEERTLRFGSPLEALRHVKLTGVNALSSDNGGARAREVLRLYPAEADGSASLTYNPIYISLKRVLLNTL